MTSNPPPRPKVGDLVKSGKSHVLGMVIKRKPEEIVGAGWIPERFTVWWLDNDKKTTEFVGTMGIDLIQVVSRATEIEEDCRRRPSLCAPHTL